MKHKSGAILLLITLGITLTACTALLPKPLSVMSPPQWIQGTWSSQELAVMTVTFTPITLIVTVGETSLNYGELFKQPGYYVSEEIKTDIFYSFTWTGPENEGVAMTFEFTRVDDNTMSYVAKTNAITGPSYLFTRQ